MTSKAEKTKRSVLGEPSTRATNSHVNGHKPIRLSKRTLAHLLSAIDSEPLYRVADAILSEIKDAKELVRYAELIAKREPGGAYYRAIFWSKATELLGKGNNGKRISGFASLCEPLGISTSIARGYVIQGEAIKKAQKISRGAKCLCEAPPAVLQNAQRQKDKVPEYLIEAAQALRENAKATPRQIHNEWCKKNGSIRANLDIIKPSDWWAFGHPKWRKAKDFPGSIPGEVYANALYYFAPRVGVAVDPMAGSGMLRRVYLDRKRWQKDSTFNLEVHLFDLNPYRKFIKQHDAREQLPVKADWIFIDPPYFGQSDHLYDCELAATADYRKYLNIMKEIITALAISLNPHGKLCIFLPKWSGLRSEDPNYNTPSEICSLALKAGLLWLDAAYVSRGRQQESDGAKKNNAAKNNKRMLSDTCVLNVFEKTE